MNYPDNVSNNFPDDLIFTDEVWDEACCLFNTQNPTEDELELAVKVLEDEAFKNLMTEEL